MRFENNILGGGIRFGYVEYNIECNWNNVPINLTIIDYKDDESLITTLSKSVDLWTGGIFEPCNEILTTDENKYKIIKIGSKNIKDISSEDLLNIIKIEGCCLHLTYWNEPIILYYNNTMFPNTIYVDYIFYRKSDNKEVPTTIFF